MLRTVVAQIVVSPSPEQRSIMASEAGLSNFPGFGPPGRAISGGALCLPGPPYRHGDRHGDGRDPAGGGDVRALDEDVARVSIVGEPPPEEGRRLIDWPAEEFEPWKAELGLEGQTPSDPLRRSPDEGGPRRNRRGAPGPKGSWSRSWRAQMSVLVRPECKVARVVRGPPDSVARKSDCLRHDFTGPAACSNELRHQSIHDLAHPRGLPSTASLAMSGEAREQ